MHYRIFIQNPLWESYCNLRNVYELAWLAALSSSRCFALISLPLAASHVISQGALKERIYAAWCCILSSHFISFSRVVYITLIFKSKICRISKKLVGVSSELFYTSTVPFPHCIERRSSQARACFVGSFARLRLVLSLTFLFLSLTFFTLTFIVHVFVVGIVLIITIIFYIIINSNKDYYY